MNTITVVRVYSDNFNGDLLTFDAYRQLRLIMNTRDFHTHKTEFVEVEDYSNVIDSLYGEED